MRSPRLVATLRAAALLGCAALVAALLLCFAARAYQLLRYPYPLDYGEGPLLAQVQTLSAGTPPWRLYADPDAPPYAVVNYPPLFHLAALALSLPTGDALLGGRLVSLLAALACAAALIGLMQQPGARSQEPGARSQQAQVRSASWLRDFVSAVTQRDGATTLSVWLVVALFLGLPIVREWAALMRVDMLGVAIGLWGLLALRRGRPGLSGALLALSLLVKPSLIAAPAAALLWCALRDRRSGLRLLLALALVGGGSSLALQLGSGGWFALHTLLANINPVDRALGAQFWREQLAIHWPLFAAATIAAFGQLLARRGARAGMGDLLLPALYVPCAAFVALGVGKVGAYTNYFLELYAGLLWLAAAGVRAADARRAASPLGSALVLLCALALLRYYPLWSPDYLKPYGMIERARPAQWVVGRLGVWQDLRRERLVLRVGARTSATLTQQLHAEGGPIFTDTPGLAAQSGLLARHQAFEHRMLLDAGRWDQRDLLHALANGALPVAAIDYLGNWLTPEMTAILTHRYAQVGSVGQVDIYRPVTLQVELRSQPIRSLAPGSTQGAGIDVIRAQTASTTYHPGELVPVLLTLGRHLDERAEAIEGTLPAAETSLTMSLRALCAAPAIQAVRPQITTDSPRYCAPAVASSTLPLLYGALPLEDWGARRVQHLQTMALPATVPSGRYSVIVSMGEAELVLGEIVVAEPDGGATIGGFYVPAPIHAAWLNLGGEASLGRPLTPAVPFGTFTQQCFLRGCLQISAGGVTQVALGETLALGDAGAADSMAGGAPALDPGFVASYAANGGAARFGPPVTAAFRSGTRLVQYTRYARLERPIAGGEVRLGDIGGEFLRLTPDGYRWPR